MFIDSAHPLCTSGYVYIPSSAYLCSESMRRSDREITDFEKMIDIVRDCDVCRLAINTDGAPYIIPLNFGMSVDDGVLALYFHGALEGTKYDLIEKDPHVSFEMDCSHELYIDEETDELVLSCSGVNELTISSMATTSAASLPWRAR